MSLTWCRGLHHPHHYWRDAELEEIQRYLADLVAKGFIQTSSSPFGAPLLLVRKKAQEGWGMASVHRLQTPQ